MDKEQINEVFEYNTTTGYLYWKDNTSGTTGVKEKEVKINIV